MAKLTPQLKSALQVYRDDYQTFVLPDETSFLLCQYGCLEIRGEKKERRNLKRKKTEEMMSKRTLLVWGVAILCFIVLMVVTPKIPQSEQYHDFADQREFFGKDISLFSPEFLSYFAPKTFPTMILVLSNRRNLMLEIC